MKKFWQGFFLMITGTALVLTGSPTALAVDTQAEYTLEEIVVTAERRESSALDTPVAVSAWDADTIDEQNIGGAQDLQMRMPSTFVTGGGTVTIRGVGRTLGLLGTEPGVGIFLDGFYNQSGYTYLTDMFDIERIENVRGPQSTLYGRATVGGAVNIISKKPTKVWSGQLKTVIGNYEKREFHTAFGGPSGIDNLYYRIRLSDTYYGGHQQNVLYDDEYCGTEDRWRITTKLLYEPTENLSFYFTYDLTNMDERPRARTLQDEWPTETIPENEVIGTSLYPNPYYGWTGYPATNPTVRDHYKSANNFLGSFTENKVEVSLTSTLELGNFTIKYLGAYRDWDSANWDDYDAGPMPRSYADKALESVTTDYEQSHELQLLYGSEDSPFSLISGLYYFDRNEHFFYRSHFYGSLYEDAPRHVVSPDNIIHWMNSKIHDINEAIYAQVDYDITDTLTLSLGGRYAVDMKKGKEYRYYQYNDSGTVVVLFGPRDEWEAFAPWVFPLGSGPYVPDQPRFYYPEHIGSWDAFTYKIGLDYKPTDSILLYGHYARGYKPGGFALGGFQEENFNAEHVNAYEAGWKQTWMASRFSTNLTAYYYDYTDLQMSTWVGITPLISNAADSYIYGVETDLSGYLIENLLASLSYSYLKTEFGAFPGQIDSAHQGGVPQYPNSPPHNPGAVFNEDFTTTEFPLGTWQENLKGNEQPYSPAHKVSVNGTYTVPTDFGDFSWHVLYFWQSEVYTSQFNTEDRKAPAYDRVDTELMWHSPGLKWRVTAWVKNVFDETTIATQGLGEGTVGYRRTATYIPPLTFGIDLSFKW